MLKPSPITITFIPGRHGVDTAACTVTGRAFTAESTAGAVFALCRELVAAGVPDAPWSSFSLASGKPVASLFGPSFHAAARLTCTGTRLATWRAPKAHAGTPPMRLESRPIPDLPGRLARLHGASTRPGGHATTARL